MNKKREDQIQFSLDERPSKKENGFIITFYSTILLYQLMDCFLKSSIHQFYKKYFHLSQNFYHALEKKD